VPHASSGMDNLTQESNSETILTSGFYQNPMSGGIYCNDDEAFFNFSAFHVFSIVCSVLVVVPFPSIDALITFKFEVARRAFCLPLNGGCHWTGAERHPRRPPGIAVRSNFIE